MSLIASFWELKYHLKALYLILPSKFSEPQCITVVILIVAVCICRWTSWRWSWQASYQVQPRWWPAAFHSLLGSLNIPLGRALTLYGCTMPRHLNCTCNKKWQGRQHQNTRTHKIHTHKCKHSVVITQLQSCGILFVLIHVIFTLWWPEMAGKDWCSFFKIHYNCKVFIHQCPEIEHEKKIMIKVRIISRIVSWMVKQAFLIWYKCNASKPDQICL